VTDPAIVHPEHPHNRKSDHAIGMFRMLGGALHRTGAYIGDFIDNRALVRRVAFFWAAWLLTDVIAWGKTFADHHPTMEGLQMAAIIGAIVGPVSATFAAVFKFYADSMDSKGP
jgi:hypothetical protein